MRALVASSILALPLAAAAVEPLPVEGEIVADGVRIEVVSEPPPEGETVELAEGWYRLEEAAREEGDATGSYTVIDRDVLAQARPRRAPPAPPVPAPEREIDPLEETCGELREKYVGELLEMAGIDVGDHPLAFLQNLQGGGADAPLSPWVRLNLFGLPYGGPFEASIAGVPVLQPLAWDFDLQRIASDLQRCEETLPGREP